MGPESMVTCPTPGRRPQRQLFRERPARLSINRLTMFRVIGSCACNPTYRSGLLRPECTKIEEDDMESAYRIALLPGDGTGMNSANRPSVFS